MRVKGSSFYWLQSWIFLVSTHEAAKRAELFRILGRGIKFRPHGYPEHETQFDALECFDRIAPRVCDGRPRGKGRSGLSARRARDPGLRRGRLSSTIPAGEGVFSVQLFMAGRHLALCQR